MAWKPSPSCVKVAGLTRQQFEEMHVFIKSYLLVPNCAAENEMLPQRSSRFDSRGSGCIRPRAHAEVATDAFQIAGTQGSGCVKLVSID